jgi:hypothetical protein
MQALFTKIFRCIGKSTAQHILNTLTKTPKLNGNGHRRSKKELVALLSNADNRTQVANLLAAGDMDAPVALSPNTKSIIKQERIVIAKRARWNPLAGLTPDLLRAHLDAFRMGYLWQFALVADAMKRRDPMLKVASSKREKAVARHGWEIFIPAELFEDDEALKHKAALTFFYQNLTATDALEQNDIGGVALLVRQIMRAQGFQYQVHEIVWEPRAQAVEIKEHQPMEDGTVEEIVKERIDGLTATFRAVPLWFFENITGRLRYLKQFGDLYGEPMEQGNWLVSVGDGLMEPSAVAYMYKNLTLKDWLSLSERWGDPKVWGETPAKIGSASWEALKQAVQDISQEFAAVVGEGAKINTLNAGSAAGAGESLYQKLVDTMDRYITTLWRGGDLSTLSHSGEGQGQGASVQGEESVILEDDDCQYVSETLNEQVDKFVIRYLFDTEPKAWFKICRPQKQNIDANLKIDAALAEGGARQKISKVAERYNREVTNPDDDFGAPAQQLPSGENLPPKEKEAPEEETALPNSSPETDRVLKKYRAALATANEPLRVRLERLQMLTDDAEFAKEFDKLVADFPDIAKACLKSPALKQAANALTEGMAVAVQEGTASVKAPVHVRHSFKRRP